MLDFTAGVDILLGAVATWQENRGEAVGEGGEVLVGALGLGREGIGEGFARQGLLLSDGAGVGGGRGGVGVGGMEKVEISGERRGGAPIGVVRSGGGVARGGAEEKGTDHGDARGEAERVELALVEELVSGAQLCVAGRLEVGESDTVNSMSDEEEEVDEGQEVVVVDLDFLCLAAARGEASSPEVLSSLEWGMVRRWFSWEMCDGISC
jgi:hypothetical protein